MITALCLPPHRLLKYYQNPSRRSKGKRRGILVHSSWKIWDREKGKWVSFSTELFYDCSIFQERENLFGGNGDRRALEEAKSFCLLFFAFAIFQKQIKKQEQSFMLCVLNFLDHSKLCDLANRR
ncbi:hypothetical protein H6P81_011720 [Aristolochia fimbriata]|uniref:Uncharacterized protein n=1 Tax=Aristolochia fimbriata TaxID=158543 RepID=A0AAV7ED12_ARIFI|nr:hypothetical protein H6P81_011720 [Aristolochia fimbriata]